MNELGLNLTSEQKSLATQFIARKNEIASGNALDIASGDLAKLIMRLDLVENTDFIINARYKDDASITEKVARKGYTRIDQMNDLAGLEIVVRDDAMLDKIIPALTAHYSIVEPPEDNRLAPDRPYNGINTVIDFGSIHIEIQAKDTLEKALGVLDHENIMKNDAIPDKWRKTVGLNFRRSLEKYFGKKGTIFDLHVDIKELFTYEIKQLAKRDAVMCGKRYMKRLTRPHRKALVGASPAEKQVYCRKIRIIKQDTLRIMRNITAEWDRKTRGMLDISRTMA
jgi:hypothetical protein